MTASAAALVAEARHALASGDPLLCQSCCLDALELEPTSPEAAELLLLASTVGAASLRVHDLELSSLLALVADPAERRFLEGQLAYQRAMSMLGEEVPGFVVRGWLDRAHAAYVDVLRLRADHAGAIVRRSLVERLLAHNPGLSER